ncbi:MAG: type 2 isopentenyl-diphosphate Delta-isomerase [Desulfurococcaceae archaeon]
MSSPTSSSSTQGALGKRKAEHIRIAVEKDVDHTWCEPFFNSVMLVHQPFPGLSATDVDLSVKFLDYDLNAPLMITGMTGGTDEATRINEALARLASDFGIAIGVGSQRPMIESNFEEKVVASYKVVRNVARDVPVIGNLGANTLAKLDLDVVVRAVEEIGADAIAIHFNPAQEVVQPEGDVDFGASIAEKIVGLSKALDKPVVLKEVGHGLTKEFVRLFRGLGITHFDVAGACGTNWALVEAYRCGDDAQRAAIGFHLASWGTPTPASIVEARTAAPDAFVIASGGVWNGIKAAKSLALGADLVGIAKPVLKALLIGGLEEARRYLRTYLDVLRTALFLTGSDRVSEIPRKPIIILDPLKTYLEQRGISASEYSRASRGRSP